MTRLIKTARLAVLLLACLALSSCDDVRVYGSVGYSTYNGYHGGGGYNTRIGVGGRIY
jgi:hypothetical protein